MTTTQLKWEQMFVGQKVYTITFEQKPTIKNTEGTKKK